MKLKTPKWLHGFLGLSNVVYTTLWALPKSQRCMQWRWTPLVEVLY
jgi:hypothetical protein